MAEKFEATEITRDPNHGTVTFSGTTDEIINAIENFNSYTSERHYHDSAGNECHHRVNVNKVEIHRDRKGKIAGITDADGRYYEVNGSGITAESSRFGGLIFIFRFLFFLSVLFFARS